MRVVLLAAALGLLSPVTGLAGPSELRKTLKHSWSLLTARAGGFRSLRSGVFQVNVATPKAGFFSLIVDRHQRRGTIHFPTQQAGELGAIEDALARYIRALDDRAESNKANRRLAGYLEKLKSQAHVDVRPSPWARSATVRHISGREVSVPLADLDPVLRAVLEAFPARKRQAR
jgi:hypothetical protein